MNRTRIVRWLRVLLPLGALFILSTLFLVGRPPGTAPQIPYAGPDRAGTDRTPRITAPRYSGVTPGGATLSLSAAKVAASGDGGAAEELRLEWRAPEGLVAGIEAPRADASDGTLRLSGGVRMQTSTGWSLTAPEILAATRDDRIAAPAGVEAQGPIGRVQAGAAELVPAGDAGAHVLNFTGGVRLLYHP